MATTRRARRTTDLSRVQEMLRSGAPRSNYYVALLGLDLFDSLDLVAEVQRGLRFSCFDRLQRSTSLSPAMLAELVQIPQRTLTRRREKGRLEPEESDRLVRASRVFGRALELFEGDDEQARHWLTTPATALGGRVPFDLARSEVGGREVETLIGRLEHGIPA